MADWEEVVRIVKAVNRDNFGLCMDTFHMLSRQYTDPQSPTAFDLVASWVRRSLENFQQVMPWHKIFYMQLSDRERRVPPMLAGHLDIRPDLHIMHSYGLSSRVFLFEQERGGYLPLEELLKVWLDESKWSGWVSMEIFHREMKQADLPSKH